MAGNDWNPNSPGSLGLEWMSARAGSTAIDAASRSVGWSFTAAATEAISTVQTYLSTLTGVPRLLLEIYNDGSEACGTETTTAFVPNTDLTDEGPNSWTDETNMTPVYPSISTGNVVLTVYGKYRGGGTDQDRYTFEFGTGAWAASRRVQAIRLIWTSNTQNYTMQVQPIVQIGSDFYDFGTAVTIGQDVQTTEAVLGSINPATGLPWTQADIVAFDSTSGLGWRPANGRSRKYRIYDARVEIDWVTENRLAVSALSPTATGWNTWGSIVAPNNHATTNWAKVSGSTYKLVLRRITHLDSAQDDSGSVSVPWLDSGSEPPIPMRCSTPYVAGFGCLDDFGDELTRLYPLVMNT